MKKADNFDAKKWLVENKITTQSRLNEAIGIGPMGATARRGFRKPSGEEKSSSSDEFSLSVVVNPLAGTKANYNYKLKDVKFEKKKVQELFGIGNLFKSFPTIKFEFERTEDVKDKKATMEIKLKDDKFVLANSRTTEDTTGSIPDEGEGEKFIDYLLNKSQWGDDLKQTFENIEQALTPASLK